MARKRYQRKGHLFLRGFRWVLRYRVDVIEDGVIKRVLKSFVIGSKTKDPRGKLPWYPTKKLAERSPEIDALLSEVNNPGYRARPSTNFKEFVELWKRRVLVQHKPSTQNSVQSHIQAHLVPFFGHHNLRDIDPELVQEYVSTLNCAPKTIKNSVGYFRMMWRSAKAWGYVTHDAVEGVVLPKQVRSQRFVFTLEEMRRIIQTAKPPYQTLFWLAAETGLRAGELLGLRVEDLDLDAGSVVVRQSIWRGEVQQPKTQNAFRAFALSPQLVAHISSFLEQWRPNNLNLLFSTRNGTPLSYHDVLIDQLRPVLERLGIKRAGMHAFRHGNATMMDRIGVPMKVRQQRLGHAKESMTRHYTHVASEDDRACAVKLGESLFPTCSHFNESDGGAKGKPVVVQ